MIDRPPLPLVVRDSYDRRASFCRVVIERINHDQVLAAVAVLAKATCLEHHRE
jgi:hypothetical protein